MRFLPFLTIIVGCSAVPQIPAGVPASSPAEFARIEQEIHLRVNDYRESLDDPELTLDGTLTALAREHSAAMAAGSRTFGHDGFEQRSEEARRVLGVARMSENVAMNSYSADDAGEVVVDGWVGSPGHLRNLRGAYDLTGIGVARSPAGDFFVTQIYAAR